MKKAFTLLNLRLIRVMKIFYCSLIVILLLSILSCQGQNPWLKSRAAIPVYAAAKFQFNPIKEWEETEEKNTYIVNGTHHLLEEHYVWIFLRDRHSNFYLQYPPVYMIDENNWEAGNVRVTEGIRDIWAIQVSEEGDQYIQNMADNMEWGAIHKSKIEELPGYRKLASYRIIDLAPSTPSTSSPFPEMTSLPDSLLIADFNTGKNPINSGGKLQQWDHGTNVLKVRTGYYNLKDEDAGYGEYAAFIELTEPRKLKEGHWSGGGLIVVLQGDESAIDVSNYQFLEFDVKVKSASMLKNTRIKLESPEKDIYIERLLSEYGVTFSAEWQTARIPLKHFATLQLSDPDFWKETKLTAITKFVTISLHDNNDEKTQGALLIDNIRFTQ